VEVGGVRHGDDEGGARSRDRDDAVFLADFARDELDDLRVDFVLVEVDGRDAVLGREEGGDLGVRDVTKPSKGVAKVLACLPLLFLGLS
jgi:hypothetical protein